MIKFKHTQVFNLDGALRGMRNSYESHWNSDSEWFHEHNGELYFEVGPNDLKLAKNLSRAGSGHDKYLRQILVSVDIIAPEYWWKEFDTYKVGTVANSTSMMHTAGKREFTADDFSFDDKNHPYIKQYLENLNTIRSIWVECGKRKPSPEWRMMIQLMANAYLYKRTVAMNYGVLKTAYHQRENHRLKEWHEFNEWVDSLPYSELITIKEGAKA